MAKSTLKTTSNIVSLDKHVVRVERSIKSHNDPKKKHGIAIASTEFTVSVDFTGCEVQEIMNIAVDQIVVTLQARARTAFFAKGNLGKDGKTPVKSFATIVKEMIPSKVNVKTDIVNKARAPGKSLFEKTTAGVDKMTPEQRKVLRAMLLEADKAGGK